jgi:hypothetical protein
MLLLLLGGACGGSSSASLKPEPKPQAKAVDEPPAPAPPVDAAVPEPSAEATPPAPAEAAPAAATAPTPAAGPLPDSLDAGDIPRATVLAVLSGGVGRFLQRVHAEPQLERGRFVGWRILGFEASREQLGRSVLREGDTVTRINGQPIERPEQFKNVWDSMATESELVLSVRRAGKQSEIHYHIVD